MTTTTIDMAGTHDTYRRTRLMHWVEQHYRDLQIMPVRDAADCTHEEIAWAYMITDRCQRAREAFIRDGPPPAGESA